MVLWAPHASAQMAGHEHAQEQAQAMPTEAGQATFAAIAEIVSMLQSDPSTDWSQVDIAALREHLVDMDRVFTGVQVDEQPVEGGVEITVTGSADDVASARRMVNAHAAMMRSMGEMGDSELAVDDRGDALVLTWTTSDPDQVAKLRGLGFFGFLAQGDHHRHHHLMIATGRNPHGME
jgi:hypothetical protein